MVSDEILELQERTRKGKLSIDQLLLENEEVAIKEWQNKFILNLPETLTNKSRMAAFEGHDEVAIYKCRDHEIPDYLRHSSSIRDGEGYVPKGTEEWLSNFLREVLRICQERFKTVIEYEDDCYVIYVQWKEEDTDSDPEPTVNFTARQINNAGAWKEFTDWTGIDYYTKLDRFGVDETFKIPLSKAKEWRLI